MKRLGLLVALAIGIAMATTPSASAVADPQRMVDVLVVMKSQPNLGAINVTSRADRLATVERSLRAYAERTQQGVLALLASRRAQGLASSIVPLWIANEVAVRAAPSVVQELAARPDVREVRPEFTVQAPTSEVAAAATSTVEPNVSLVNAPALWDMGFRGQGVVVANMDTGVDATHPDLAAKWRGGTNSWYDPNGQHPTTPTDVSGHGTQTMGVMVGGNAGGSSIGVAPDAKWIAVKIFNDQGSTTSTRIHQGFQWLLDPDNNPSTADAPNVVNNSWTMMAASCTLDFQPDLANLRAAGIVPVFAAGNSGPTAGTVLSPANLPEAFAVGGTDDSDALYPYSSRGPSSCAGATAPKLAAPAVSVRTTDLYGGYVQDTGTSVAAPHVAGALALLLDAFPNLSADQQEAALKSSAQDLGVAGLDNSFGYGRLDALAAYQWLASAPDFTVSVSPSSATVSAGGSTSFVVSVARVNGFAGDVALSLSGLPASQAAWSFSPPVVAGGTGTAQLSVATAATIPPGSYPLTITGTSTGTSGALTRTATATLAVPAPPDFTVSAAPSSQSVPAGGGTSYSVAVSALNGFTGTVALSLTGLPASGYTFTPAAIATAGTSLLAISSVATATPGTYPLTVTAASGSTTHTAAVTLVVTAPPDFNLSSSPSSVTVSRGQTASYTVSTSSIGAFTGSVSLTASGLPSHATATWVSNPIPTPGSTTLQLRTTSSTSRGTFTVRVTGTSGTLSHQVTVTLVVR
jgi:subtilisin family serine protease